MPAEAERQIKKQGGTARYRTLKRDGKLFTCAVTREEGPKGGRTVCWPKKSVKERRQVSPEVMERAINHLRRRNPTGYAQWMVNAPFGIVPSHAWEDENAEWWSSEEAFSTLRNLRAGALGEGRVPKFQDICKTAAAVNCLKGGQKFKDIAKSSGTSDSSVRRWVKKAGFSKKGAAWRHASESVVISPSPHVKQLIQ